MCLHISKFNPLASVALAIVASMLFLFPSEACSQEEGSTDFVEGTARVICPAEPLHIELYQKVLKRHILESIDDTLYTKPRVKVQFSLRERVDLSVTSTFDSVLSGLSSSQLGLSFALRGDLNYQDLSCRYYYQVRVIVTATDASGVRLRSSNDSIVTITSTGQGRIKRLRLDQ